LPAFWYSPTPHVVQPLLPAAAWAVPAGHAVHRSFGVAADEAYETKPAGHAVHVELAVAPASAFSRPAGQPEQALAVLPENCPSGHSAQCPFPDAAENRPAAHAVHPVALVVPLEPADQPAGQPLQLAAFAPDVKPGSQLLHCA
jgi:hypothetical protein